MSLCIVFKGCFWGNNAYLTFHSLLRVCILLPHVECGNYSCRDPFILPALCGGCRVCYIYRHQRPHRKAP